LDREEKVDCIIVSNRLMEPQAMGYAAAGLRVVLVPILCSVERLIYRESKSCSTEFSIGGSSSAVQWVQVKEFSAEERVLLCLISD
jgi:hypothetical protein